VAVNLVQGPRNLVGVLPEQEFYLKLIRPPITEPYGGQVAHVHTVKPVSALS
jgi:hypothetical protein